MRALATTLLWAALLALPVPSHAGFVGAYAPSQWTSTLTGNPPGGGFPVGVDASGAPASITIVGGDSAVGTECWDDNLPNPRKGCAIFLTAIAAAAGTVSFDWSYYSYDNSLSAYYDAFGYVVGATASQLTDDYGGIAQGGSTSFPVLAGQTFGFWLDCGDCGYYEAIATVSAFAAPEAATVPSPATLASLGIGLAALGAARRRRPCGDAAR